jgi:hypothetical protein
VIKLGVRMAPSLTQIHGRDTHALCGPCVTRSRVGTHWSGAQYNTFQSGTHRSGTHKPCIGEFGLVSDISAGDGKTFNLFYSVCYPCTDPPRSRRVHCWLQSIVGWHEANHIQYIPVQHQLVTKTDTHCRGQRLED